MAFRLIWQFLWIASLATALKIDENDRASFVTAAKSAASNAVEYYNNRQAKAEPGKFDGTWWEGGAFFNFLINYWHWTGDDQYNDLVTEGLSYQAGSNNDFYPSTVQGTIGNDDQEFWALAAMTAAEQRFPDNPKSGSIGWLGLAQGAFNDFKERWEYDKQTCNGGLRWQLVPTLNGYTAKNSISNGAFFQLAARLYWYTGNDTYATWANTVWDWSVQSPLFNNQTWKIEDIAHIPENCEDAGGNQWSYNYGSYAAGAAYMYNKTNNKDPKWKEGLDGILKMTWSTFFLERYGGNIFSEVACDPWTKCDRDQLCFKGLVSNWLSLISQVAPYTSVDIIPKLKGSAVGAGLSCTGESNNQCGQQWYANKWDGTKGIEQEMSALSVFANSLVAFSYDVEGGTAGPVDSSNGGNSSSNPDGGGNSGEYKAPVLRDITGGDRAGAAIVTMIFCGLWLFMIFWLLRAELLG